MRVPGIYHPSASFSTVLHCHSGSVLELESELSRRIDGILV